MQFEGSTGWRKMISERTHINRLPQRENYRQSQSSPQVYSQADAFEPHISFTFFRHG
jgi:hypothetical protein